MERSDRPARTLKLTRRRFVVAGSAGASVVLGACVAGPDAGPARPTEDLRGVALEHWTQNQLVHPTSGAMSKILSEFATQSNLGVTVTSTGGATLEKVVSASVAGTPPDLADNFHFNLSQLFKQGATLDIDAELKGSAEWKKARAVAYPELLPAFTWKGKLFAIPAHNSFFAMYYQPEMLKRANLAAPPPRSWGWDQFLDYNRRAIQPPDVFGYDDQWSYSRTGMMVLNNGHRFMSADNTKFSYNSNEAVEAVEFQQQMIRQGLMRAHDGSVNGGYTEKLPEGKVVFQFGVQARTPLWRTQGVQFGACVYPLGPKNAARKNTTHGESYGVAVFKTDSKRQQASLLASLWATRPESGFILAKEGGVVPSYKSTVEAPEFQAAFKSDAELWTWYELLPNYVPMPNFPGFADVRALGDTMIRSIWANTGTAREILNDYTRQAQEKLDEALRG